MVCFFHFVMRFRHLKNSSLIENNGFATAIRLPALKSAEKVNPQSKLCAKVALLDGRPPATRRNAWDTECRQGALKSLHHPWDLRLF